MGRGGAGAADGLQVAAAAQRVPRQGQSRVQHHHPGVW